MNADELRAALEAHPKTIHAGAPRSPSDLYCLARIDDVVELVYPPDGGVTSTPTPGPVSLWLRFYGAVVARRGNGLGGARLRQAADLIDELTLPAGEWRVSVGVDGTRTVTPLREVEVLLDSHGDPWVLAGRAWADAPENGDPR